MALLRAGQLVLLCLLAGTFPTSALAVPKPAKIFAVVSKVDGNGTAKVRRVAGTEAVVGQQMEIYAGDRIFTDDSSTVEVVLHDGTLIRIGIRSEFKLNEVENRNGVLSWVFDLMAGTVRSLIEKSQDKKTVKVRFNTPAGTMGIRGTEITLEHRRESGITTLYTLEGNVEFGALGCEKIKTCVEVRAGKLSSIKVGDKNPAAPSAFSMRDLLGLAVPSAKPGRDGAKDSPVGGRLALFQGISLTNAGMLSSMNDAELAATVRAAQDQLQAAQNKLLGRNEDTRQAMHAAMKEGTYDDFEKVAEAYIVTRGGKGNKLSEMEAQRSGMLGAKKFVLGKAIVQSNTFSGTKSGATDTHLGISAGTASKTTNSNLAYASLSNEDISALVSKNSANLKRATTWANTVKPQTAVRGKIKTVAAPAISMGAQTYSTVKSLMSVPNVEGTYATYMNEVVNLSSLVSLSCDLFCVMGKIYEPDALFMRVVTDTSINTSTRTATAPSATALCSKPVTVCKYTDCNTTSGRLCPQKKECSQVCR